MGHHWSKEWGAFHLAKNLLWILSILIPVGSHPWYKMAIQSILWFNRMSTVIGSSSSGMLRWYKSPRFVLLNNSTERRVFLDQAVGHSRLPWESVSLSSFLYHNVNLFSSSDAIFVLERQILKVRHQFHYFILRKEIKKNTFHIRKMFKTMYVRKKRPIS